MRPNWMIQGFRGVVRDAGLQDIGLKGYPFTWERSRGKEGWVEEKLDQALANPDWRKCFPKAVVSTVEVCISDHLLIFLDPQPLNEVRRKRRFRFENIWLKEPECKNVIQQSWNDAEGVSLQGKLARCGEKLFEWGSSKYQNFKIQIGDCKKKMVEFRGKRDTNSMKIFDQEKKKYSSLLHNHEIYWKQRAKVMWLKEGDNNTRFFHNQASARRRRNSISRLRNRQGNWCTTSEEVDNTIFSYYSELFKSGGCVFGPIMMLSNRK